jgi:hypothetical protein
LFLEGWGSGGGAWGGVVVCKKTHVKLKTEREQDF